MIETAITTGGEFAPKAGRLNHIGNNHFNSLDELVADILIQGRPVTAWEASQKLGSARLTDELEKPTAGGVLAKFRAGLISYYAPPMVALTGKGPGLGTVLKDTIKCPVMTFRNRFGSILKRSGNCTPAR